MGWINCPVLIFNTLRNTEMFVVISSIFNTEKTCKCEDIDGGRHDTCMNTRIWVSVGKF
jgi:hypothetical protein